MFKVFVDTCVWFDWLDLSAGRQLQTENHRREAEAFKRILEGVISEQPRAELLFNERIVFEMNSSSDQWSAVLAHVGHLSRRIPIPATRADGSFLLDGSFLAGGSYGGSLAAALYIDGRDYEHDLHQAWERSLQKQSPLYDEEVRRKEFDIENLESALEAGADYFVSTDMKLRRKLERVNQRMPNHDAAAAALRLMKLPTELSGEW